MSYGFQNNLVTEEIGRIHGRDVHLLVEPLVYIDGTNRTITIPKGFICDFDSVPQRIPLISLLFSDRPIHRAATLHDYLYRKDSVPKVSKEEADLLFLEAMYSTGLSSWLAKPIYLAVKWFGKSSYGILEVGSELFHLATARCKK